MQRLALIIKVAGLDIAGTICGLLLAWYGATSYMASDAAELPFVPAIYAFGVWPYVATGLAALVMGVRTTKKIMSI